MLKFSFVTHLFLAFRRGKGLGMSSILHSFETAPLKIFPPRVISMFLKNKEDEKPRLSYFDMEGDANSAPSSRKFITVSRRIPSPSSSNYAPYPPSLECDENHPPPPWTCLVITPWKLDTKREAWQSCVCTIQAQSQN